MGLRIVYGRAGSGKSSWCIQEIIQNLQKYNYMDGKTLLYLVPEQFTVQAEKMLLSHPDSHGSLIRADVINFKRMAHRLVTEMSREPVKLAEVPGRRMMLYKALEECKGQLKLFQGALDHLGMVNELLQLLEEAGRYQFTPERIRTVLEEISEELPIRQKLAELALIMDQYEEILHRSYVDEKDLMDMLMETVRDYTPYQGTRIWIDGFFGFTPQEYAVIRELLFTAEQVTITLCCDDPNRRTDGQTDFLHSVYYTYDKLVHLTEEHGILLEPSVYLGSRKKSNAAINHFEQEYDRYPARIYSGDVGNLGIFAGKHIDSEVEHAAGVIRCLCRDYGLRYRDIAVVAKNIEQYAPVCKDVFARNQIPFFLDVKKDITRHPLVRLIIAALDIIVENFSYKSMFTYLKTGLLTVDQTLIDKMENHVLKKNISSFKRWIHDDWWVFEEEDLQQQIRIQKQAILEPLIRLKTNLREGASVLEQAEVLYSFLKEIEIPQMIANRQEASLSKTGQTGEYIQVWNNFLDVLDQMAEALGKEAVTPSKFANILQAGLEDYQIGAIPSTLDGVQIGNLERTKNAGIRALLFLGVNEGVVPGGIAKEGLLSDKERMLLQEHNIRLAADSHEQAYLEEFQIYAALMAPSDYLFLSYVVKDISGKSKRPSRIIARIQKMFPGLHTEDDILEEEMFSSALQCITSPEHTFMKYLSYLGSGRQHPVWNEAGRYFAGEVGFRQRMEYAAKYQKEDPRLFHIAPEKARGLFGEQIITSISRVERYHACPYAFYMQYGMKARQRELLSFDRREAGSFVHEILERIGGNLKDADIDAIVKEVIEEKQILSLKDSGRSKFYAKRIGTMVRRVADIIAGQLKNSLFQPYEFEAECNMQIPISGGRMARLTGKIDRIDLYEDQGNRYYRIIDYKTGARSFDFGDVYQGTAIQLLAYLDSVTKADPYGIPAGGLYFHIQDSYSRTEGAVSPAEAAGLQKKKYKLNGLILAEPEIAMAMDQEISSSSSVIPAGIKRDGTFSASSWVATETQFQQLFGHVERKIAEAIAGYTAGRIAPNPVKKINSAACDYCSYHAVCGFDAAAGHNYRKAKELGRKEIWEELNHDH